MVIVSNSFGSVCVGFGALVFAMTLAGCGSTPADPAATSAVAPHAVREADASGPSLADIPAEPTRAPEPEPEPEPTSTLGARTGNHFESTVAEAKARGLPPCALRYDIPAGMSGPPETAGDTFMTLSTPGGDGVDRIVAAKDVADTADGIAAYAMANKPEAESDPGPAVQVKIAGAKRWVTMTTGTSMHGTVAKLWVLVPAEAAGTSVVVTAWSETGDAPAVSDVIKDYPKFFKTLAIDCEG